MAPASMEEVLPPHMHVEILNWVVDARDLANCMAVSKAMHLAVRYVQNLHLICRKKYYHLQRERFPIRAGASTDDEEEAEEEETDIETDDEDERGEDDDCCGGSTHCQLSPPLGCQYVHHIPFKQACLDMLEHANILKRLKIEIEPEMQANPFQKDDLRLVDFWLSEPMFVRKWVSHCSRSLQHLSLVDYGQQAIIRQSPIVRILSEHCKMLRILELRNMFLDTDDLHILPNVTSLTLRCIKMTEQALTDINLCMPALQCLVLVSVHGLQEVRIESASMLALCLGLSTKASVVDLDLPNVSKLQLKMTCPDFLRVCAPNLAYVAVCMKRREDATVKFEQVSHLRELLFGDSHFWTLSKLIKDNPSLEKVFLDVPCMALGEGGKWEGVLRQVPTPLPDVKALKGSCPCLHTLSLGPGIWHSIEIDFEGKCELSIIRKWPDLKRLIVHMIIQSLDSCLSVLRWLVGALPSLEKLEIYVHTDSHVELGQFVSKCKEQISHTDFKSGPWKKSICFSCFSF